jgi:predicted Zn-dependent protease
VELEKLKPFSVKPNFTHREILSRTTVKGIVQVASLDEKLNTVLVRLTKSLPIAVSNVRINVVASMEPGQSDVRGGVYLGWGVFEDLESEEVLAALIAHELAHVLLRHGDEGKYTQVASNALRIAALRGLVEEEEEDTGRLVVADLVSNRLIVPLWEQGEETAADRLAVEILAKAGYAPYSMYAFVQKMSVDRSTEQGDVTADRSCSPKGRQQAKDLFRELGLEVAVHPRSDRRINDVADYIRRYHKGAAAPDEKASARYRQWLSETNRSAEYQELVTVRSAARLMVCGNRAQAAKSLDEVLQRPGPHQTPTQVVAALAHRGTHNNARADEITKALLQSPDVPLALIANLIQHARQQNQTLRALELSRRVRQEYYFPRDFYPVLIDSYINAGPAVQAQSGVWAAKKLILETKMLQLECARNQDKILSVDCYKGELKDVAPLPDVIN